MSEETKTISPAEVAAQITADAPRVSEPKPKTAPVPETAPKPETENGKPETRSRDIIHNGKSYDPAHYRLKADGSLFLNRHGHPMPRGGRKPKTVSETAPKPETETAVWSETDRAAATAPLPETENGKPETAPEEPEIVTPAGTRRAAAKAGTRALYMATGVVTGNPDEAMPPSKDDKELQETAAYIMQASGWNPGPGIAFIVLFLGYVIFVGSQPKNREALAKWWRERNGGAPSPAPSSRPPAQAQPARNATGETPRTPTPDARLF